MFDLHTIFATTQAPSEKTASAEAPAATRPATSASAAVAAAVNDALASGSTKTAGEAPPASALTKLAGEVAGLEKQAAIQEAHLKGRAMADGFMAQLGVYEKVAAELQASQAGGAAEQYAVAEKRAAWEREFVETEQLIEKKAAEHYLLGFDLAREALS